MLLNHKGNQMEIKNGKILGKYKMIVLKQNILNNPWVKDDIRKKI